MACPSPARGLRNAAIDLVTAVLIKPSLHDRGRAEHYRYDLAEVRVLSKLGAVNGDSWARPAF